MTPRQENTDEAVSPTFIEANFCATPNSSTTAVEDAVALHPCNTEVEQKLGREAERKALFQKVSNDRLGIPNGYRKVEVLLIRWHESIDPFKGHGAEIQRLRTIFESGFNYNCTIAELRNIRHPQLELNHAITEHVMAHDGEENLLIVYYTGHGGRLIDEKGLHLRLSALEYVDSKTKARPATAFWEYAEQPLRSLASADALAILDCCFAGTAAVKGMNEQTRAYHLLAASPPEGITNEPGPTSFTSALCDSLEDLLKEANDEPFPLVKLCAKINSKPEQCSMLWDRLDKHKQTFGNIELGRLRTSPEREESFKHTDAERASLTLRFSLKTEVLSDDQIKTLAHSLSVACKEAEVPVRRMEWVEFEERGDNYLIRKVVDQMRRTLSGSKLKRSLSRQSIRVEPPDSSRHSRGSDGMLSPPDRNGREEPFTSE